MSRILRTSVISGMPSSRTGSRVSSVAHRMGSTAFLLADGTMRPDRAVAPWTIRWDMPSDRRVAQLPAHLVDRGQQLRRQRGAPGVQVLVQLGQRAHADDG